MKWRRAREYVFSSDPPSPRFYFRGEVGRHKPTFQAGEQLAGSFKPAVSRRSSRLAVYFGFPKGEGVVYSRRIHTYEVAPSAGVCILL